MTNQLQTVHDKLEKIACLGNGDTHGNSIGNTLAIECLEIVKQMLQAEPVAFLDKYGELFSEVEKLLPTDTPLYAAPQAVVAAPQAVPAWLPIESAPKDELILVGPTKRMGICAAMNHSRDGWVTETCGEWSIIYTPTHWMPLPSAPKGAV